MEKINPTLSWSNWEKISSILILNLHAGDRDSIIGILDHKSRLTSLRVPDPTFTTPSYSTFHGFSLFLISRSNVIIFHFLFYLFGFRFIYYSLRYRFKFFIFLTCKVFLVFKVRIFLFISGFKFSFYSGFTFLFNSGLNFLFRIRFLSKLEFFLFS